MLNSIHVENFRKHADLTVNFTPGINAIRASNEAGKSTMLEAIAYAYFGTKGIKDGETIADVVSYDVPLNKLLVDHSFTVAGVTYRIVRSPKGAELTAPGVTVTGQNEVTKFVEKLFGADAGMASKLMMARQKALGGALSGGATAAGKMIEDLADLGLIDEVVGLITEGLPSGNTAATEGAIEVLRAQAEPGELPDLGPLEKDRDIADLDDDRATHAYLSKKAELDNLDLDAARAILRDEQVLQADVQSKGQRITVLSAQLAKPVAPAPAPAEIDDLRAKIEAQKSLAAANKLHAELQEARILPLWDEPMPTLVAEIEKTEVNLKDWTAEEREVSHKLRAVEAGASQAESEYRVARTRIEGKLVKDTTCGLCQKDLKDVPEVARFNSQYQKELDALGVAHAAAIASSSAAGDELRIKLQGVTTALTTARAYLSDLQDVIKANAKAELLYARAGEHITLDTSTVPALWTWTGPSGEPFDYASKLRELEADRDRATRETAAREQAEQQITALRVELKDVETKLAALQLVDARETLELEAALKPQVQALLEAAQQAERALSTASQAYELARQQRDQKLEAAEKAKAGLTKAEATLAEMQANNALVKKVREARPKITDKLWAITLAAVSTYASDVRGERSVITRADGKFKINGRPVSGLSGSAEDVLGLAIRFALTKTFLGVVDFVILDEVAAACDDQRELAMLGLLATSGFAQTILVTHSPLADAFSDNIITF